MAKHKLVIAFPIYNGAKTMERSLQCIANQTHRDFRAIIVENRSIDNTLLIARKFCEKDSRFELIENDFHRDVIENFSHTIKLASERGEYFCLRACDDLSTPDYIGSLLAALEADPSKMLAVGSVDRYEPDGIKHLTPKSDIFDFKGKLASGKIPRGLIFPSEWFYGVVRSAGGAEIMLRRWPELGRAWCAASYTVAEFVVRDLIAYVPEEKYLFFRGSNSENLYKAKTFKEGLSQRWRYTTGCFRIRSYLPHLSWLASYRLFRMFWRDARRKTGYRLLGKL